MGFIEFTFNKNFIILFLNYCTLYGTNQLQLNNIYLLCSTSVINWIICYLLSKLLHKQLFSEKKEKIKVEQTEKGILVTEEKYVNSLNDGSKLNSKIQIFIAQFIRHIFPFYITNYKNFAIYLAFENLNFLFIMIGYYFFFGEKIYLHHFLSISVIIALMFFSSNFSIRIMYNITSSILYFGSDGLCKTYVKYLMQNKFVSPYLAASASSLFFALRFYLKYLIDSPENKKNYLDFYFNGYVIIYVIVCSLDSMFENLTIYYFSPFHNIILQIISRFNLKLSKQNLIMLIIHLLFTLIYCEVIILNFWHLGTFTKENIRKRGEKSNQKIFDNLEFSISSNSSVKNPYY